MNEETYFMDGNEKKGTPDERSKESERERPKPEKGSHGRKGLDESNSSYPKILPSEPWPEPKPDRSSPKPDK